MTDLATMLANLSGDQQLALLGQLAAKLDKGAVKAALKAAAEKPTLKSLTLDAIVHNQCGDGNMTTDALTARVTDTAIEHSLLKAGERHNSASVNTINGYVRDYIAAWQRLGVDIVALARVDRERVKSEAKAAEASTSNASPPANPEAPKVDPVKVPEPLLTVDLPKQRKAA